MSRFKITPAAASRLGEMVSNDERQRDVIVLSLELPRVDNRRGPTGEVQWIRHAKGTLLVDLAAEEDLKGKRIETVGDLRFFVVDRPRNGRIDGCTIDHTSEGFTVE